MYLDSTIHSSELENLRRSIPKYPISVRRVLDIAHRKKMAPNVLRFYQFFPESETFDNEDDMVERSKLVSVLRSEDQPAEDVVRGAED